jgi:hypothetical protein
MLQVSRYNKNCCDLQLRNGIRFEIGLAHPHFLKYDSLLERFLLFGVAGLVIESLTDGKFSGNFPTNNPIKSQYFQPLPLTPPPSKKKSNSKNLYVFIKPV